MLEVRGISSFSFLPLSLLNLAYHPHQKPLNSVAKTPVHRSVTLSKVIFFLVGGGVPPSLLCFVLPDFSPQSELWRRRRGGGGESFLCLLHSLVVSCSVASCPTVRWLGWGDSSKLAAVSQQLHVTHRAIDICSCTPLLCLLLLAIHQSHWKKIATALRFN